MTDTVSRYQNIIAAYISLYYVFKPVKYSEDKLFIYSIL